MDFFSILILYFVEFLHYQVAGVPGVTEALFVARQSALDEEKNKLNESPMLYSCGICGKGYRSSKAHAQHLKSRSHIIRTSQGMNDQAEGTAIIRPLPPRSVNKAPQVKQQDDESEGSDEWEEVDPDEDMAGETVESLTNLNVNDLTSDDEMNDDDLVNELDPSCCFMCDLEHDTIESCMVHMHKHHGFFIPDVEYLNDPKGLLTYLGLKVISTLLIILFSCLFYLCQL